MQKINSVVEMKEVIMLLEIQHAQEEILLKEEFLKTFESLKPLNIIKDAFKQLTVPSGVKNGIADTAIGMTTGYIAKKVLLIKSHNPIMKLLGIILEVGVANFVTKHPDGIKFVGGRIFKNIFGKRETDAAKQ